GSFADRVSHFNADAAHTNLETWLRVYSGSVEHASILQRESGMVPGTLNAVADQLSFRKRAAEMRAGFRHGKDAGSTADQENRNTLVLDALGLGFWQIRVGQERYEIARKSLPSGAINTHSVFINHLSAQTRGGGHDAIAQRTQNLAHIP